MFEGLRHQAPRVPDPPTPGSVLLEATEVSVSYDGVPAVADVDLAVASGQVTALVGPNGAGKSTLLGILAGDHAPDTGQVTVDGAPLPAWSTSELAVRRGVLLQQVDVSFPFTVTQVVRMGRTPWAGTPAEDLDDPVVAEALADTDMGRFTHRVFTTLSGGERSRAALSRVLTQEPTVLLLDEPTASLDIRHQELVLDLLRGRAARGDAVVVVLHDLSLAAACADVVVVMDTGRVAAAGPPDQVLTAELLTRVYDHPVEILRHPRTGAVMVVPHRQAEHTPAEPGHPDPGGPAPGPSDATVRQPTPSGARSRP